VKLEIIGCQLIRPFPLALLGQTAPRRTSFAFFSIRARPAAGRAAARVVGPVPPSAAAVAKEWGIESSDSRPVRILRADRADQPAEAESDGDGRRRRIS